MRGRRAAIVGWAVGLAVAVGGCGNGSAPLAVLPPVPRDRGFHEQRLDEARADARRSVEPEVHQCL